MLTPANKTGIVFNLINNKVPENFYASLDDLLKADIKINRANNKLVFMQELQGGVLNKIFIQAVNKNIASFFNFSNAQVSKINL